MKRFSRFYSLLLILALAVSLLAGCGVETIPATPGAAPAAAQTAAPSPDLAPDPAADPAPDSEPAPEPEPEPEPAAIAEDGIYTTAEDVALYLHTYGHLPANFITKTDARKGGWEGGSLEPYFPDMCIGGDRFGNREGLLPTADGRTWTECDINTLHASSRGAERLVFSNDGLIYYTGDHYESFQLLYDADGPAN